jgi:YbbR domain-containing protein
MRWLLDNLSSLLLALILALTVWVAAVSSSDPIELHTFPNPLAIEFRDLGDGLVLVDAQSRQTSVSVRAPRSVWNQLSASEMTVWVDLKGLAAGKHQLPIHANIDRRLVQVSSLDPATDTVTLEAAISKRFDIDVVRHGEPAVGFRSDTPKVSPTAAQVVGPTSAVDQVDHIQVDVDLTGRSQPFTQGLTLQALDSQGQPVSGVTVSPTMAQVSVGIEELGGYRSVVVLPKIDGEVEPGYQLTGITVQPTLVTVFSSDPNLVDQLGGFVETEPVSLAGVTGDIEKNVGLSLPDGVAIVGEKTVAVRVSISPIENSIKITRPIEVTGLRQGLFAQASPNSVSIILIGPVPILDNIQPGDVRVVLDLLDKTPGTYQLTPQVLTSSSEIKVQSVLPDTIEITISTTPPPTAQPTAAP